MGWYFGRRFDEMAESTALLPGGSRVEGFEVDQRSARRQRRAAVLAICAVAGVACLATASVSHAGSSAAELLAVTAKQQPARTAQLQQQPIDKADAYLQKHGVPSWLSTSSVALKPLNVMIQEQLAVKKMASKQAEQTAEKKAAQAANAPTPHELAMKNVLHAQATTKVAAKSAAVTALKQVDSPVKHAVADTTVAGGKHGAAGYHKGELKAKEKDLKQLKKEEREEELVIENSEKEKLKAIRDEEIRVNKEEVHKLAKIKAADAKQEKALMKEIEKLQAQKSVEQMSEKRAIKAEMAKIEDEEREKLHQLQAKMSIIKKGGVLKDAQKSVLQAKKATAATETKAVSAKGTTSAVAKARGHKVVQKPAVKVHADAAAGSKTPGAAVKATAGAATSALKDAKAVTSECTTTKCDLEEEDRQWGKIGGKVDDYAREASHAHGKAKAAALAHMQYLQEQIEKDYKHVTGFATAQEHALPPAPSLGR